MPEFTGTKDLRSYLRIAWRWKYLILLFVIGAPLAAYLVERGKPTVYQSSAIVGVNQATVSSSSGSFSTSNVTAIAELVTTTPVADVAAALIHTTASQVMGEVTANGDTTTNFVTITATDRSAARAAEIANAFATAITRNLNNSSIQSIKNSISNLQRQIAHTKNQSVISQLQSQISTLEGSEATSGKSADVVQPASPSRTPAGPHLRRTVELGLLIGILLAIGAAVLAEGADRRLRTPEDLEAFTGLPLLASIAPSAFSGELDTSREDDEAFQMLRTALMYFNVEHLDSVLVTSPGEKDGKTTVATRLALVTARAGMKVVLIDADLRRAQVSARLGLRTKLGLGAALANQCTIDDVLVDYDITHDANQGGQLLVVPAGAPPPNPAALISSPAMQRLLGELQSQSDLVIIDTPAALAVSDPLALVPGVSGVVIVARMNRSTRQTIRRLQKMIIAAHGTLLGVVATGVTAGEGYYEHYATKYYAQNGSSNGSKGPHILRRRGHTEADSPPHE